MKAGWQETVYLAACFAAASAIFFLTDASQQRFGPTGLGAPPLLILATATALGMMALVALRQRGFLDQIAGGGLRRAVWLALLLLPVAAGFDLATPMPAEPLSLRQSILFYPALAVVSTGLMLILPLALAFSATGWVWLSIALAGLVEPAHLVATAGAPFSGAGLAQAATAWVSAMVGLTLFRWHGLPALFLFRLVTTLGLNIVWATTRTGLSGHL